MTNMRDALRALRAAPIVSTVAVLSLALGIGANTAIFSILNSLLLRALPVHEPERLVLVDNDNGAWTNPQWEALRERQQIFSGVFAWSTTRFNLGARGQADFIDAVWASGEIFEVLGVRAMLGRTFTAADDRRGGGPDGPVAVISDGFWQRRFGGRGDTVGRILTLERVPFTIVGIAPPEFFGVEVGRRFDVIVPIGVEPVVRGGESILDRRSTSWLQVMARLRPGQTRDAATAAVRGIQPQIRQATMPDNWPADDLPQYLREPFSLRPAATGASSLRNRYQQPLVTLMVVVGLVLLVACANVANLLLGRAAARRHELSVRLALGVTRLRLARQLLSESLLLAGIGAALGVAFAAWASRLLVRQISTSASTVFLDLTLDWPVLGFAAAVATVTALIFGTVPALRATRVQPIEALNAQGRGSAAQGRVGLGSTLIVAQVAMSLVLVVTAGLFVRTLSRLATLPLGFDRDPVLLVTVDAGRSGVTAERRMALYSRLREAVEAVPGVAGAALSVVTPVSGRRWQFTVGIQGEPARPARDSSAYVNLISPEWFATYGTPLLAGRDFTRDDRLEAPRVAIVNEAFARKFTGGANPIGRVITQPPRPGRKPAPMQIVGLVKDAVYRSLRAPVPPTMYQPLAQFDTTGAPPISSINVSVRAVNGSPALLARGVAAALERVDKELALTFRPLADQVNDSLLQERLLARLSGFFGVLALLLAGLGLYGVTSYGVSRRRREIGIRMALGAAPSGVVGLVLARVALLVGVGVLLGIGASLWAARFVATLLFGLGPRDPWTLAGATVVLAVIGALAAWLPARRAAQIDPARVLREG